MKTETTTDNCAATIAEEKHGDFAEQNHVKVLLGSYFPCLYAHLFRNDVDSQQNFAKPYRSTCTDIYACLVHLDRKCTGKVYLSEVFSSGVTPFMELPHVNLHTHTRKSAHTHTCTHSSTVV